MKKLVLGSLSLFLLSACTQTSSSTGTVSCATGRAIPSPCTYASTLSTGFTFQYGGADTFPTSIATSGTTVFVSAYATGVWLAFQSTDQGVTLSKVDAYSGSGASVSNRLAADPSGRIFAGGRVAGGSPASPIRRSSDNGATWANIDDATLVAGKTSSINGVATGPNNLVLSTSYAADSSGVNHLISRRSTDGGTTWAKVDDFQLAGALNPTAGIGAGADYCGNNIYVAGWATNLTTLQSYAFVRRSTSSGRSWSTVDTLNTSTAGTQAQYVTSLRVLGSGKVAYTGFYYSGSAAVWFVRMSSDGGTTWQTVDAFQYVAGIDSTANDIVEDNLGNLYAIGFGVDSSSYAHSIVRRSVDKGATWTTFDDYTAPSPVQGARGIGGAVDSAGNLYFLLHTPVQLGYSSGWIRTLTCS